MASAHTLVLTASCDSTDGATQLIASLRPEATDLSDPRSSVTVRRNDAAVIVELTAQDLTALRAAMNTWVDLLAVAERISVGR